LDLSSIFDRGLNPGPCIYSALSILIKLSSREHDLSSIKKEMSIEVDYDNFLRVKILKNKI